MYRYHIIEADKRDMCTCTNSNVRGQGTHIIESDKRDICNVQLLSFKKSTNR